MVLRSSTTPTPRCSSPPARPRRSPARCSRCASRATRSSPSSRTTTRTPRASRSPARTGVSCSCARPTASFDPDALARAITPTHALILLNSPHNPTGKVFSRDELELIARLCVEHDLVVVTDEVYEHLVFDGRHVPLATLPGMRERTVTISSGGKTFSCTGWKIGWVCAPPDLVDRGADGQAVPHLRQRRAVPDGVAVGLGLPDVDVPAHRRRPATRSAIGCAPGSPTPGSTVFPLGRHLLRHRRHPPARRDRRPRVLPRAAGAVRRGRGPERRVLRRQDAGRPLVRFAFCKRLDVIDEAVVAPEGSAPVRVAAIQHDIVWEDRGRELRAPRRR